MSVRKIVITGGPCAGKTTGLSWIQNALSERGYRVLFIPETATELRSGGIAPWSCGTYDEYQIYQIRLQIMKEQIYTEAAENMKDDKILIVCDRGIPDNRAYMTEEEYVRAISDLGLNEIDARDGYDAVFHLETAAKGAEQFYTLGNNAARTETPEQARQADDNLIASWTGHPHFRIIDNSTDFEGKMRRLIAEIVSFLGEPEPYQIERKYLIEYPDIAFLESLPNCRAVEIEQIYLASSDDKEIRIRKRGYGGNYIYFKSEKREISPVKRIEIERRLTGEEYEALSLLADKSFRTVVKKRYCLSDKNQYFEIDIYPEWNDKAILEIEIIDEKQPVTVPEFISVIREVTDDASFRNHSLARIKGC